MRAYAVRLLRLRRIKFSVYTGSKKSLSQGITMAKVIFASHAVGAAILPLMLFHQIQLMVCAALAQRWGRRAEPFPSLASAGEKSLLPH
jgi:sodium/bile acid cotransporter 7